MRVLITGATGGLGAAMVARCVAGGSTVIACDHDAAALERQRAAVEAPEQVIPLVLDLTATAAIHPRVTTAIEALGGLDVLVNNAGLITRSSTVGTPLDDWNRVLAVNLTGAFALTQAAIPHLTRPPGSGARDAAPFGRIVTISSRAARKPHRNAAPSYGATKAALQYLTRHWSVELYERGILAFSVSPGPVATPMFGALDPAYRARISAEMITGAAVPPQEVAALVWYLATECGPAMTGQDFACTAGTYWN